MVARRETSRRVQHGGYRRRCLPSNVDAVRLLFRRCAGLPGEAGAGRGAELTYSSFGAVSCYQGEGVRGAAWAWYGTSMNVGDYVIVQVPGRNQRTGQAVSIMHYRGLVRIRLNKKNGLPKDLQTFSIRFIVATPY